MTTGPRSVTTPRGRRLHDDHRRTTPCASRILPTSGLPRWAQPPRGWQPYAIFVGLPLWWLAGFSFFMWPLITLPLVYPLVRRGEPARPPPVRRLAGVSGVDGGLGGRALERVACDRVVVAAVVLLLGDRAVPLHLQRLPRAALDPHRDQRHRRLLGDRHRRRLDRGALPQHRVLEPGRGGLPPLAPEQHLLLRARALCSSPSCSTSSASRRGARRRSSPTPTHGDRPPPC